MVGQPVNFRIFVSLFYLSFISFDLIDKSLVLHGILLLEEENPSEKKPFLLVCSKRRQHQIFFPRVNNSLFFPQPQVDVSESVRNCLWKRCLEFFVEFSQYRSIILNIDKVNGFTLKKEGFLFLGMPLDAKENFSFN